MDRNFIIAMVLMVLVLFAWQALFAPPPKSPDETSPTGETPPGEAAVTPTGTATPVSMATPPPAPTPTTPQPGVAAGTAEVAPTPASVVGASEQPVINPLVQGTVSNMDGGSILRWALAEYNLSTADKDKPEGERDKVNLAPYKRKQIAKKKQIPQVFPDQPQLVCALHDFDQLDGGANWQVLESSTSQVVLQRQARGLTVTKTMRFHTQGNTPDDLPYNIDVSMKVENTGGQAVSAQPFCAVYEQIMPDTSSFFYRDYNQPMQANYIDNDLEVNHIAKVEPEDVPDGPTFWTGFADNYFASLIAPDQETISVANARARIRSVTDNVMEARLIGGKIDLSPGQSKEVVFKVYLGPKLRNYIQAGENGPKYHFDKSIDFGWFDAIARYLMLALVWLADHTGNYGVAILVLTFFIKILLFPLQHKSFKSMRAMQVLQPEIAKLREQYKDNKEKMNQELMGLYKRYNVNPAGGCLPLLVQLPIFIAFYRALGYAIELRQTPFFWWLQDLSAQDPYYITPILMGASMFVSQKMTPTAGDPMQAKMMMMMPVVFTFLFLSFPSGLVLYWLMNNVLSVAQQIFTNRYLSSQEQAAAAVAAKGEKK